MLVGSWQGLANGWLFGDSDGCKWEETISGSQEAPLDSVLR